jgi:hypothetical protein
VYWKDRCDCYLPNRISAEANSSRASLKLNSSRGGGKYDADDAPLPTQNLDNIFLFWLEICKKNQDRTIYIEMAYLLNLCQPDMPWGKPMKFYSRYRVSGSIKIYRLHNHKVRWWKTIFIYVNQDMTCRTQRNKKTYALAVRRIRRWINEICH